MYLRMLSKCEVGRYVSVDPPWHVRHRAEDLATGPKKVFGNCKKKQKLVISPNTNSQDNSQSHCRNKIINQTATSYKRSGNSHGLPASTGAFSSNTAMVPGGWSGSTSAPPPPLSSSSSLATTFLTCHVGRTTSSSSLSSTGNIPAAA